MRVAMSGNSSSTDGYGDHHRHFLQALMSSRVCSNGQVRRIYEEACARVGIAADICRLAAFVNAINARLGPLGLRVAKGRSERDGATFYSLVSVTDDALAAACASYSDQQLHYIQQLLDELMAAAAAAADDGGGDGSCSMTVALNLSQAGSCLQAEQLLEQLVAECWLEKLPDGGLMLHARALLELGAWLVKRYGADQVRTCGLCTRFTLYGTSCCSCAEKFHTPCLRRYQSSVGKSVCAKCKEQWAVSQKS